MTFNEYQAKALMTADLNRNNEIFHLILGLAGEVGEITEKFKKIVRDQDSDFSKISKEDMKKELGDVLWYVTVLGKKLDIDLSDVAEKNIEKLASRQKRNKLHGSGDNR